VALGHAEDLPWCAALDVSPTVPVLRAGAYVAG
jgi:phosphosulfolactate phosphohydrolase-like enzyme